MNAGRNGALLLCPATDADQRAIRNPMLPPSGTVCDERGPLTNPSTHDAKIKMRSDTRLRAPQAKGFCDERKNQGNIPISTHECQINAIRTPIHLHAQRMAR